MSDNTQRGSEGAPTPPAPARDARGRWLLGRRSRAMQGNMHAMRFPWRVYWRKRALRPEDRWVLALVADYIPEIVADKGGEAGVTAAESRLAELAAAARVCWLLALASPAAGARAEAPRFMAIERQSLQALGLERRARPVPSLRELLEQRSRDMAASTATSVAPTPPAERPEEG